VEAPARRCRSPQALDVPGAIVVIEHMEQPAVQHRVELLSQALEVDGVPYKEPRVQPPRPHLPLGDRDRRRGAVDTQRGEASLGCHQCVLAGSAANIQNAAVDLARVGDLDECGLRAADVPRRLAQVARIEVVHGPPAVPGRPMRIRVGHTPDATSARRVALRCTPSRRF
jgi:hypothetical protein